MADSVHRASEAAIVKRIIAGDVECYGELMTLYEPKLLRYVHYLLHDSDVAADVVQETFIKAYQNLRAYDVHRPFSSWIYRIAHNQAMNMLKKERHIDHTSAVEDNESNIEMTIETEIDQAILGKDMKICLDQLEVKYREVLMLQYYENMKYSEIADVMHVPVRTVGVWSARAKAKMKALCIRKGVHHD